MHKVPMNPKMEGSACIDCRPQTGLCPNGCPECFYNRPGAFYCDINDPQIPNPELVGDRIVRMNSGHDSNLQKDLVIKTAEKYEKVFFNTSIPDFDFPGPVVFTANGQEEDSPWCPIINYAGKTRQVPPKQEKFFDRLMFVRVRVSPTNLECVERAVACWTAKNIPVVLTFMAYYSQDPPGTYPIFVGDEEFKLVSFPLPDPTIVSYQWKVRTLNSYWCATPEFESYVLRRMHKYGGHLVTMCGTLENGKCKDCNNCRNRYEITAKYLKEKGAL